MSLLQENPSAKARKAIHVNKSKRIVVVAVDSSQASWHAFEYAAEFILNPQEHFRIIHCQPYREVVGSSHMGAPVYSCGKVRQESKDIAKMYAKRCRELGIADFTEHIICEDGSVGKAIVEYVHDLFEKSSNEVLLVLGTRESNFFKKVFMGSTSEYCVKHCHSPVLVIKMPHLKDTK